MGGALRSLCVLVADDLTGACDAGVPFAVHGVGSEVLLDVDAASRSEAEVAIINVDSRCDTDAVKPHWVLSCEQFRIYRFLQFKSFGCNGLAHIRSAVLVNFP